MMYGSNVFRVVRTLIEPSTRLSSHEMPFSFRVRVTTGQTSRKYFSVCVCACVYVCLCVCDYVCVCVCEGARARVVS